MAPVARLHQDGRDRVRRPDPHPAAAVRRGCEAAVADVDAALIASSLRSSRSRRRRIHGIASTVVLGRRRCHAADAPAREVALDAWRRGFTRVEVPGNRSRTRAAPQRPRHRLASRCSRAQRDEWLAPQAGMPLYPAFFGRDALTAGWQAATLDRGDALEAALTRLGRLQSDRVDDWRDEQPGRIPYQVRTGPLALLNLNPYSGVLRRLRQPADVRHLARQPVRVDRRSASRLERHWDTARRILDWAREYGDRDGDGYLEYQTRSSKGTKNQGWKDSGDAIVYDDGSPVPAPIATCELQGYWYVAQELMGCWRRDERARRRAHTARAAPP